MCNDREVNLPATQEHMVEFLVTNRSTADSLRSLRIIMKHKKGHISHESRLQTAKNRTQGHICLWMSGHVCNWKRFLALGEQTKWRGQGAKRPGAERVSTCPGLSNAAPLNRPLKNRPAGKTTPPSINHSNYKAEKEKQGKRRGERGVVGLKIERQNENRQVDTRRKKQIIHWSVHFFRPWETTL